MANPELTEHMALNYGASRENEMFTLVDRQHPVFAADLDGTLAPSKSPAPRVIAEGLGRLMSMGVEACVITGGTLQQIDAQVLPVLEEVGITGEQLTRLTLMPTCGTRCNYYDFEAGTWRQAYAEDLTPDEVQRTMVALEAGAKALDLWAENPWGDIVEDRGSQVTFSALGQQAPVHIKESWDPRGTRKDELRALVAKHIPDLEVRAGGTTSIDVTRKGVDKAYGMHKLMQRLGVGKRDVLFVGDRLGEGGNDAPVKGIGIDTIQVTSWKDTAEVMNIMHARRKRALNQSGPKLLEHVDSTRLA